MPRVLRRECVLLLAGMLAVCNGDDGRVAFQVEPLGAVGFGAGEAVQTRSPLSYNGAPSYDLPIRYGIELALGDGGSAAALQIVGVIHTSCSGAAVTVSLPLKWRRFGCVPAVQHLAPTHLRLCRQTHPWLQPRLFPHFQQRAERCSGGRPVCLPQTGPAALGGQIGYNLGGEITIWGVDGGGRHERHGERVQAELRQHVEVIIEFFERV